MTHPPAIRHYYHVFAAGAWQQPVAEHITALAQAGLHTDMVIGLIGTPAQRDTARDTITTTLTQAGLAAPVRWIEAAQGWEQVTLRQIHFDVHRTPGRHPVLYAHTKGAHDDTDVNRAWRRAMTRALVTDWQHCTRLLDDGHDTAGCHWITRGGVSFYAGNFGWATANHLRTLPPPDNTSRWEAETWVSSTSGPNAADVLPGFPTYT